MAKYYFTEKALKDLSEIWDYTTEVWSEKQAEKYYDLIVSTCQELAENPQVGRQYDILSKGILGFKSGEHILFYIVLSVTEIEVVRILQGRMDLKSKLYSSFTTVHPESIL